MIARDLHAGIVFPESLLSEPWFGGFALFVGLNTVIYLGLTLAKFVPWPAPVHPAQVRTVLRISDKEDDDMPRRLPETQARAVDLVARLRAATATQTIPLALALVGIVGIIVGLVNTLLYLDTLGPIVVFSAVYGLVFVVVAQVMSRTRVSSWAMTWTWTGLMIVLIVETCWRAALQDSAVVLAYAVIALVVLAPIALSWRAGVIGALLGLAPIVLAGVDVTRVNTLSWAIAACTGALASFVLLQLRFAAIARVAAEQVRAQTLESTDPLTGTFSRTGILALAPAVAQAAEQSGSEVGVVLCRIEDINGTNADYGFAYGNDVLVAVARALRSVLPPGALIARWGGETFLALLGEPAPDSVTLRTRIDAALVTGGVALGKRPVVVDVGCATGRPETTTLEDLIAQANQSAAA
jgi:diguanylate cyclase (GGDEF)-like protein